MGGLTEPGLPTREHEGAGPRPSLPICSKSPTSRAGVCVCRGELSWSLFPAVGSPSPSLPGQPGWASVGCLVMLGLDVSGCGGTQGEPPGRRGGDNGGIHEGGTGRKGGTGSLD